MKMLPFLQSQLANESAIGVDDLCLDYSLVSDLHPARFVVIAGLELFPDLSALSIAQQDLIDVDGLRQAPLLRVLDLNNNALQALGAICELHNLEFLDLSHNEIETLDGIEALTKLENLQIGFNLLSQIAPLAHLPRLMTLVLNGNRSIHRLDGLPPSLLELHLAQCFIQDFSGLAALKSLRALTISPGSMAGLGVLSDFELLDGLHIQAKRMHGRLLMPANATLQRLRITGAQLITALVTEQEFPGLEILQIHHSPMRQPPSMEHFPNLKHLEIKHSPLENLDGIAALPKLKSLVLEGSRIPQRALQELQAAKPDLEIEF